jgi:DNA-binding transcriptional ArsR family regulator
MADMPDIASLAALVAEPARCRMLTALMDGRALTASELALEGGVVPSTASSHLARLTEERLLAIEKQGRHRYFRIASGEVAGLLETMMQFASRGDRPMLQIGPRDRRLRHARVCYDHLAGELAVELFERMKKRRLLRMNAEAIVLTRAGIEWLRASGIDAEALRARSRRPLCRPCLDWSERRTHLAGAVGAALLDRMFALQLARRDELTRAVVFSPRGEAALTSLELSR